MKQAIGIALELNDDDLLAEPVKAAMKNASECATGGGGGGGGGGSGDNTYSMSTIHGYVCVQWWSGKEDRMGEGRALCACAHIQYIH